LKFSTYLARLEALSVREHLLLAAAVVGGLGFIMLELVIAPLQSDQTQATQYFDRVQQVNRSLHAAGITRPDGEIAVLKVELAGLQSNLVQTDRQLQALTAKLTSPEQMNDLLETVLAGIDLQLVALKNLPVEPLQVNAGVAGLMPMLYKHSMQVELRGTYADTIRYLQVLEQQPLRFSWRSLQYEVQTHPLALLRVEIQTLSFEPQWLGYRSRGE